MASTKSRTSVYASQTLTAGAGDTTSGWQNLADGYGALVGIKLTNGATGPTVAAQVQVQTANDTSGTLAINWGGPLVGKTDNNGEFSWPITLPMEVTAFRIVAGSNTGENVTLDVDFSETTAV